MIGILLSYFEYKANEQTHSFYIKGSYIKGIHTPLFTSKATL